MKLKHLLSFLLLAGMTTMFSCSEEDLPITTQSPESITKTHSLTVDQAIARSAKYIQDVDKNKTRNVSRTGYTVECITTSTLTRSQTPDTVLYLVNYQDDNGFLMMTTDDRLLPVYAFSDTGNLNLSDTTFNEPLRNYINSIKQDAATKLNSLSPTSAQYPNNGITMLDYIEPQASPYQSKIGQRAPYNSKCPLIDGKRAVAGCVPVAFEIALSCLKNPSSYLSDTYHWDQMNNGENDDDIATILARLGDKNNLNTTYGLQSSGTRTAEYYARTFNNFGYPNVVYSEFSNKLASQRLAVEPLVVRTPGHAWVIDGVYYPTLKTADGHSFKQYFFHCVWGWNGSSNGFYLSNDNTTVSGEPTFYWEHDNPNASIGAYKITHMIYQFKNVVFVP